MAKAVTAICLFEEKWIVEKEDRSGSSFVIPSLSFEDRYRVFPERQCVSCS